MVVLTMCLALHCIDQRTASDLESFCKDFICFLAKSYNPFTIQFFS